MPNANVWTRDQLLMALRLYMRTSFGRLHGKNPEIIELASNIGRTPNALAMKASNFASIDPKLNRKGLSNSSQADREIWNEFEGNPTQLALEAEEAAERLKASSSETDWVLRPPQGDTEVETLVKVRRVQSFFRSAVMISYDSCCAISGLAIPELLIASHIIPWNASVENRANPRNGIMLNALFDRAFDRGLITFDEEFRVIVSKRLREDVEQASFSCSLAEIAGEKLRIPKRFPPSRESLEYHRTRVFKI